MKQLGRDIIEMVERMGAGECIDFDARIFEDAFSIGPWGGFPGIYRTSIQMFLSNTTGSAWGRQTAEYISGPMPVVRIEKHWHYHEPYEMKRVYVDPDREDLFKRMPDGSLEHIDNLARG